MRRYIPSLGLVAGLSVATTLLLAAPASADAGLLSDAEESAIRSTMTEGGIDLEIQDQLVDKMEHGEAPDSLAGKGPVRTMIESTSTGTRTISIFADGSRSWTELELPTGASDAATRSSISGCRSSAGWKVGCRVGVYDLISSATFVIDYQTSTSGRARVRDMRSLTCDNVAGSCTRSGSIKRATQSAAGPAWAELRYTANLAWATTKGSIGIRVSGTSVSTY
ncbi:hypothetical protein AB1285_14220 [Microbacterium sp. NRRL B-14842]|uniref:hypothetical protein n=1 Tax=Microbacterium sp. NRRL B-14842 TaxID=3162881 RepID=UPI003513E3F5